jgi:Cu+-exporting ATPase
MEPPWASSEWRRRVWWSLVGLAETGSEHPIGKAVLDAAKRELGSENVIDGSVGDFESSVGRGISAYVEPASAVERKRYHVVIGNASYLHSQGVSLPADILPRASIIRRMSSVGSSSAKSAPAGTTQIHVAIDGEYAGSLSLADTLKPTARATILALTRMGISASLVTGDQMPAAMHVASLVGIAPDHVHAGVSPDEKQAIVKQLQGSGETVAMVGDGINDSPALATANIGIALSSGTDVAMEAADIVIMRPDDLLNVAAALSLARTIFGRIKLNLGWACLYNLIGLPFAMGLGLALPGGFMLPPMAASAAMAMSSVSVVGSSLLLKFWKRPRWMTVLRLEAADADAPFRKLPSTLGLEEAGLLAGDELGEGAEMRRASWESGAGEVRGGNGATAALGPVGTVASRMKRLFWMRRGARPGVEARYVPLVTVGSARSEAFGDVGSLRTGGLRTGGLRTGASEFGEMVTPGRGRFEV